MTAFRSFLRGAVLAALSLAAPAAHAADVRDLVAEFSSYDFDLDGTLEIESLEMAFADDEAEATPAYARPILLLVEERLFASIPGGYTASHLTDRLDQWRKDLRAQGYTPRVVVARVYDGPDHQDGKTVLALRELFRATLDSYPDFAGAVLVGNFPDAMIVRSFLWRKNDDRLTSFPQPVARRTDLILSDLDGDWEDVYVEGPVDLPSFNSVLLTPSPLNPGPWPCDGCVVQSLDTFTDTATFEDFFHVQDGDYDIQMTGGPTPMWTITMNDVRVGPELGPDDPFLDNPIAQPEIVVSRIDARRVAVVPDPAFRDLDGKPYLDAAGRPQAVRTTANSVAWVRDAALERRLLVEYFDRLHLYRAGNGGRALRTSAITFPEEDFKVASTSSYLQQAARPGFAAPVVHPVDPTVLDFAEWLRQPATLKGIHAHAERRITEFGDGYSVDALEQEAGPYLWNWVREGDYLVSGFSGPSKQVGFPLYYTMWRNSRLASTGGVFYLHNGCDVHSPTEAENVPFDDPAYGVAQNAESHLFFLNGVAMVARSKDFNDKPEGFTAALAESASTPWGRGWLRQFEVAAEDTGLVDTERKRSYNWGLLGDWTLALAPPRVDSAAVAFDGRFFIGPAMRLEGLGIHELGDFPWTPLNIDSIAVPNSRELRISNSTNGLGRYITLRDDLPDVGLVGFDDWIRSAVLRVREHGTATLYSEANYWGNRAVLPPGHYTFTQLRDSFGLDPRTVSSISLSDVDVYVYDRQTWWNNWKFFTGPVSNLTASGWNDRIESIVVLPRRKYATAYQNQGFAGKHVLLEPGTYDTADLQALGLSGWAISSLYVGPDLRLRAYRQSNFGGTALVLDAQSVGDLIPYGWNDAILSIVVERR